VKKRLGFVSIVGAVLALAPIGSTAPSPGTPKQLLLIRHAEETGRSRDTGLSNRGVARANALPSLFPARLPTPDAIFAARSSKSSTRPLETITKLAGTLGVRVDTRFANTDYAALAKELLTNPAYAGKTILVCWHHGTLPELAAALGVRAPPTKWRDTRFDLVWSISFGPRGAQLEEIPQKLLPGDQTSSSGAR
jgi:phosphohistidine phosphatase SixA